MRLLLMDDSYGVCRLSPAAPIPDWVPRSQSQRQTLVSITYTTDELSIVCPLQSIPNGVQCERNWRCIKIIGPLDFGQIGIISSLTAPLARNSIPVFIISTFDTDYILVKETHIDQTKLILQQNQHQFHDN